MLPESKGKDFQGDGAYRFWTPPSERTVITGSDRHSVSLPPVPLPLYPKDLVDGDPSDDAIGRGVYDYLRQFPDSPHSGAYAELLRDAFPHYLADLAAQIVMIEHKEVDAPYVRRQVTSLKILALLDPGNPALLHHLGRACQELGLLFSELMSSRTHLLAAMGYLQRSLHLLPDAPSVLNDLGQIDFLFGDYPAAARRWRRVAEQLEDGPPRQALLAKVARIEAGAVPDHPLIDDLEAIGEAMALYGRGDVRAAALLLERLEEEGTVATEFPSSEFYYLLGTCREACGDAAGAFAAFDQALALDPDSSPVLAARERILDKRRV